LKAESGGPKADEGDDEYFGNDAEHGTFGNEAFAHAGDDKNY
jgi:hypothetical protein